MNPLSKNAILLNLHIRMWGGEVNDQTALSAVAKTFDSDVTDDKYKKSLFVGDPLREIKRGATRLRTHFYAATLPWLDGGNGRLIPSRDFREFSTRHKELVEAFEVEVDRFLDRYDEYIAMAREQKAQLFHEYEYPDIENVRSRFEVKLSALPFPESTDFRVEAPEATIRELREQAAEALASVSTTLAAELEKRISKRIQLIHDGISKATRFKNKTFTDSLEPIEMVDRLEECLPEPLVVWAHRVYDELLCLNPDEVRDSEKLRSDAVAKCHWLLAHSPASTIPTPVLARHEEFNL